jgi:predicted O-methyltransferase YrrM
MSKATCVAARLSLPDLLADGPRRPEELATATATDPDSLRRLLRALTTVGLFRETDDGAFELTTAGARLRADAPDSLRAWALYWEDAAPLWARLQATVETGESARSELLGTEGFAHLEADPAAAELFHRAMSELARPLARALVETVDFSGFARVVDIGGGAGETLAVILAAHPGLRGALLERPGALERARRLLEEAGLLDRCELIEGDFFEAVPPGADAYLLKSVLHDWRDDRARSILAVCLRAMSPNARLLVVERVVPERLDGSPAHRDLARSDLHMRVALGSGERTKAELGGLLESAGFRPLRWIPLGDTFHAIEAAPRS